VVDGVDFHPAVLGAVEDGQEVVEVSEAEEQVVAGDNKIFIPNA